ncbi:MAG: leucine-rich repeat domain-containing protein [Clostridia bacterium]|nr:leucine-rich repeat domain-containing protein [Clostridia bacterium]
MKLHRILILCALLLCAGLVCHAAAEEILSDGDFTYVPLEDGGAELVKYTGTDADVVIPDELGGRPVTAARGGLFFDEEANAVKKCTVSVSKDHPYLAVIDGVLFGKSDRRLIYYSPLLEAPEYVIPEWTLEIGDAAFRECSRLWGVTIPYGVTAIGDGAFAFCDKLRQIEIPASVTGIGRQAFVMSGISELTIPAGVKSIGASAFFSCPYLSDVTIAGGVTRIGNGAFAFCRVLHRVTIMDGVSAIGDGAFGDCRQLKEVTIPASVTDIGEGAFTGCRRLTLTVPAGSYAERYCADNGLRWQTGE